VTNATTSCIILSRIPAKLVSFSLKWIGLPIPEIYSFEIFQVGMRPSLGFGSTGSRSTWSVDTENHTLEPAVFSNIVIQSLPEYYRSTYTRFY